MIIAPYTGKNKVIDIVSFTQLSRWKHPIIRGYAYSYITNKMIEQARFHPYFSMVNVQKEHEDDNSGNNFYISMEIWHAIRIAKLAECISFEGLKKAIIIDTMTNANAIMCIPDGHHRIRAMQYLGHTAFYAGISGFCKDIEQLLRIKESV